MRIVIYGDDVKEVEKAAMALINYANENHSGIAVGKSHQLAKGKYWKQVVITEKIAQANTVRNLIKEAK